MNIQAAIRAIGLALHASNGVIASDDPRKVPDEMSWRIDHTGEIAALEHLESVLKDSFKQLAQCTLDLIDLAAEVRCVDLDDGAARTGKATVRLEPSDRFGRVSAAIAARDIDALVAEHVALLRDSGRLRVCA